MNELYTTAHEPDCGHDVASINLEQLLASCLPRAKLLPLVKEKVRLVIAEFVQSAPISIPADDAAAPAKVVDYLRGASAIPLQPELCTLMARVGFDKALFTYGNAAGTSVGYAEGLWLLKFVEFSDKEQPKPHDESWLRFLGKGATRH